MKNEIILALDVDSLQKAKKIVNKLYPVIKTFKVGLQLFTIAGKEIINFINSKGGSVFLDLKYYDIPNTVGNAVKAAAGLKVKMLTLHISGGEEMLKAAIEAAEKQARALKVKKPLLMGVTVLTSQASTKPAVLRIARAGIACGLDGVVCSARETAFLRKNIKSKFYIVTPGIRPGKKSCDDQKRTATAEEAIAAGSNFLVVGRPILEAKNQLKAAKEMVCLI